MLTVYTLDKAKEWDKLVQSFKNHDVYWLSGYLKGFMIHGEGEPCLLYYNDGTTRAINAVMKRDLSNCQYFKDKVGKGEWFDFSTPYGYGGWLVEGDNFEGLFSEYKKWCVDNNIVSEFVRFHPIIKNHLNMDVLYNVVPLGETVTMDLSSKETVWENLTSKNRNVIRKAEKNGITIHFSSEESVFEEFKAIYNSTMDKDNADDYYYFKKEFYDSVRNDLPNNAGIFYAKLDDKIVSASIILFCNGMLNYHLSGSVREFSRLAPTNLLLCEVAKWGSENGYKTFYLGGGVGSEEDSLFKFKKAFYKGDDLNRFYIGKCIFNQEKYNQLVKMRGEITKTGFFPLYRV